VADDDLGDALGFQFQHQVQKAVGVGFLQGSGRFVEDQQADVLRQGLGDFDQLLLADTQLADDRAGGFVQADLTE
jgi:hypothetical protein